MACFSVSIHAPGLGKRLIHFGKIDSIKYGADKPIAMQVKTVIDESHGIAKAAPTATPKNGAIQGVATTVAKKPEKKEPR